MRLWRGDGGVDSLGYAWYSVVMLVFFLLLDCEVELFGGEGSKVGGGAEVNCSATSRLLCGGTQDSDGRHKRVCTLKIPIVVVDAVVLELYLVGNRTGQEKK